MKLDRMMLALILIGLISSGWVGLQRFWTENGYKNYELTVDYDEMERFAAQADRDIKTVLSDFEEAGVASVNIHEATINNLKYNKSYKIMTQLSGYDLIVKGDRAALDFIEKGLSEVLRSKRKMTHPDENTLIIEGNPGDYLSDNTAIRDLEGNPMGGMRFAEASKLEYVGLGYIDAQVHQAKKSGMKIALRPSYVAELQDASKSIRRFASALDRYKLDPDYILFSGQEALGWDEIDQMAEVLKKRNIAVAMVESSVQREHLEVKGMKQLVEKMDYKAIRAFTTWQFIQRRYDYEIPGHHQGEEIVNTYYRAITERNIRLIYFKPFIQKNGKLVTDQGIYKLRLNDLENRLWQTHRIVPGKLSLMRPLNIVRVVQMISALGVLAASFVLLDNLFKLKRKLFYNLFGLGALAVGAIYLAGVKLDMLNKVMGLLSTIIFPTLSVLFVLTLIKMILHYKGKQKERPIFFRAVSILLVAILISLMGALYQIAFFAHSRFLLEMDIFQGVKLSQVAPMGLTALFYLVIFGYKRKNSSNDLRYEEVHSFLMEHIQVWQALAAMLLFGAVALLLLRSGHESNVQPSSLELLMRNSLEYLLPARPRTKAFMIGYPALMLLVYLAYHKCCRWVYPLLALMMVIGQSNILNTFSHIRTPLYVSFLRVGYEVLAAFVVGGLWIVIAKGLRNFFGRKRTHV